MGLPSTSTVSCLLLMGKPSCPSCKLAGSACHLRGALLAKWEGYQPRQLQTCMMASALHQTDSAPAHGRRKLLPTSKFRAMKSDWRAPYLAWLSAITPVLACQLSQEPEAGKRAKETHSNDSCCSVPDENFLQPPLHTSSCCEATSFCNTDSHLPCHRDNHDLSRAQPHLQMPDCCVKDGRLLFVIHW